MLAKPVIVLLLLILSGVSFSQSGGPADKAALRDIEKHRWEKAASRLHRALSRDTLNPSARYGLSLFYFHAENPRFHLDSAYHYAITSLNDYRKVSLRTKQRLTRLALDSARLVSLRAQIDSTAFAIARQENTESAYLEFLSHFPSAVQRDLAEELRDEVAYQSVLKENTPEAFKRYLRTYPNAARAGEAQRHYDRLLFHHATRDQRLSSYEKFLAENPQTPYREEVYRNIFEISTAGGEVESFLAFINRHPSSRIAKRSQWILFYLLTEDERPAWPQHFLTDSLRALHTLNQAVLIPFFAGGRYGFMDEHGVERIPALYDHIHDDYVCGNIETDILIVDRQLVRRDGVPICPQMLSDSTHLTELGAGYVMVTDGGKTTLLHKAGFVLQDSVEDARVLNRRFVAVKKANEWWLYSFAGRLLDKRGWDDITALQNLIVLSRDKQKYITRASQISRSVEAALLQLSAPFDEVKPWSGGLVWGKSGNFEGVINDRLETIIRFDQHVLTQTFFGATAQLPNGIALYNRAGRKSSAFDDVKILGNRVAVKKNRSWSFFDPGEQTTIGALYDSLTFQGPFFISVASDTLSVHFNSGLRKDFYKPRSVVFIPGMDSSSFLVIEERASDKTLFDGMGNRLFTGNFEGIEYSGLNTFTISGKGKKGLVNTRGQRLLPMAFDAIGSVHGEVVSVLKNRKFGVYHLGTGKFIKPRYDRNPVPYTQKIVTAFKDGYYGLVGWDDSAVSRFEFDEINYWSDSVALVRQGSAWGLYDIPTQEMLAAGLRKVELVKNTPLEKIAIVQKGPEFGVISNSGKEIIPMTFSKVINLGSSDVPLYFTEKDIPEASLHVVIYYDASGRMVRKEIYDDVSDYDKIYCSDQ